MKQLFIDIKHTPFENRLKKAFVYAKDEDATSWYTAYDINNAWNYIRNLVTNEFITIQDRVDCLLPDSVEAMASMSDEEIAWFDFYGGQWSSETYNVWQAMDNGLMIYGYEEILTMDLSVLKAMTLKCLTLTQRAQLLPSSNVWGKLEKANDTTRESELKAELVYLYNRIFEKTPLAEGETMPSFSHGGTDTYGIICTASHLLSIEERIAYLPTVEQYQAFSVGQKNIVYSEVKRQYGDINDMAASDIPDMSKLNALRPLLFSLSERMSLLPPKAQIESMTDAQRAEVRDEVLYLYSQCEALTISNAWPSDNAFAKLRAAASVTMTLQERIDRLPSVADLAGYDAKETLYVFNEASALRTLVDALGAGDPMPDNISKLVEVENYFTPSAPEIISNETELEALFNTMNSSGDPLVKIAKLGADFAMSKELTFSKGNLTLLGCGYTITSTRLKLASSANLSLGRKVCTDDNASENVLTLEGNGNGAAIINMDNNSVLNVCNGVTLQRSIGSAYPGGVNVYGYSIFNMYGGTIQKCLNRSSSTCGGVGVSGNATFNMYDGTISECYGYTGGAIRVMDDGTFHMLGGTIKDCKSASYGGGAVALFTGDSANFIMDGGTIENCSAGAFTLEDDGFGSAYTSIGTANGFGGAVFVYTSGTTKLNGGLITKCSAKQGGAVLSYTGKLELCGTEIRKNTATSNGGGIYVYRSTTSLEMTGGLIVDNVAGSYGGGIALGTSVNATFTGGTIDNNTSTAGGGIFAYGSNVVNMSNLEIINNSSTGSNGAGAYYHNGAGTITITNCKINGNKATHASGNGGALRFNGQATVSIIGGEIVGNTCNRYGGAIYIDKTDITIDGTVIASNLATLVGGGIYVNAIQANLKILDATLDSNVTGIYGGAICVASGTIIITDGEFVGNSAPYGGAIALPCINMHSNIDETVGATVTMNGGSITQNSAFYSGGIYIEDRATVTLNDGVIARNYAEKDEEDDDSGVGGGLYVEGVATVADGFRLYDNIAELKGDDISMPMGTTPSLTLGTACNETLTECHVVDGWYPDNEGARISNLMPCFCYPDELASKTVAKVAPGTYSGAAELNIKASHAPITVSIASEKGRMLDMIGDTTETDAIAPNGVMTVKWTVNCASTTWYLGTQSEAAFPAGTMVTLEYYPDGTASSVQYFYCVITTSTNLVPLANFNKMGGDTKFERTDTTGAFVCQMAISFPDGNTLDAVDVYLTDVKPQDSWPNASITFGVTSISAPSGSISMSNVSGGDDSISATFTVSELDNLDRVLEDDGHIAGNSVSSYSPVIVVELLDENDKHVDIPSSATVTIDGNSATINNGLAFYQISANGNFECVISSMPAGSFKISAELCATENDVIQYSMGMVLSSNSAPVSVEPFRNAICVAISGEETSRIISASSLDSASKNVTFKVQYTPAETPASQLDVVVYVKQSNGDYEPTSQQWSISKSGNGSDATVVVTIPAQTDIGTYRIVFTIGTAVFDYNLIITNE